MRTRLRAVVAVGVLSAVTILSGCGADPSVAAYVGDTRITQQQVDSGVAGVNQALTGGTPITTSDVVNVLVHGDLAERIAAATNISITDGERDRALAARQLTPLLSNPDARTVGYDSATEQIVVGKLGQERYLAEMAKIPVTLNPRFGLLDPQTKTVITDSSGSLSIPLATPEAATP